LKINILVTLIENYRLGKEFYTIFELSHGLEASLSYGNMKLN